MKIETNFNIPEVEVSYGELLSDGLLCVKINYLSTKENYWCKRKPSYARDCSLLLFKDAKEKQGIVNVGTIEIKTEREGWFIPCLMTSGEEYEMWVLINKLQEFKEVGALD